MENLLNDIINGKHNVTLFVVIIFLLFHIYYKIDQIKEPMAETDISSQIKEAVKQVYLADVEAIRNLSEVAIKLQKEGLTIPGNLTVTGNITSSGNIVSNNISSNGNLLVKGTFNYLPKGTVVSWTGTDAPEGWALCNGQNGTPDLRGRFVLAAGQGDKLTNRVSKQIGGEETVILTIDQMPQHNHKLGIENDDVVAHTRSFKGEGGADRTIRMKAGQAGLSEVISLPIGKNQPHNNMPPFYVLAYIMKL